MRISIAMATYNGGKYLRDQLDSFVQQSRLPDEVIISDDASTDNTIEIIEEFSMKAPFEVFYFINERNIGYAENFDRAIRNTSGELVFLSDQDDVWFSEKIETIEGIAEKNVNAMAIMNDALLTDAELNEVGFTKLDQFRLVTDDVRSFVMGCCAAIRRDLLDLCMPIPKGYKGHDIWILSFAEGINRKMVINKVLQYYRRHPSNESKTITSRLEKLTKRDIIKDNLKKIVHRDFFSDYDALLYRKKCFLERVEFALPWCSGKLRRDLNMFREDLLKEIPTIEKRIKINKCRRLFYRIPMIVSLWKQGGYSMEKGYKEIVRDLLNFRG